LDKSETALYEDIRLAVDARREEIVRLLRALVQVPSISGDELAIQEVIEAKLRDTGLSVERCEPTAEEIAPYAEHVGIEIRLKNRPNVVAKRTGAGGGRSLLLNGHVDTVENGDHEAWRYHPLSGTVEEDLLYGRGSCDMKGGLATVIAALDVLNVLGIELAGDVTFAATVGEEDTGVGSLAVVVAGHKADAAIVTEPTRLALVPAQAGSLIFRLTITGSASHAATRRRGVSAFEKFVPIFEELMVLEKERTATLHHPLYSGMEDKAAINVGTVQSGNWAVTVPERLVAEGRVGLLPGEELESSRAMVAQRIMDAANRDPWLCEHPPEIEWFGGQSVPSEIPVDSPICEAVTRSHERVTGEKPRIEGSTYGSDMRFFNVIGEMPCVMYGAGDVGWAHGADEHISITDLLIATKTIACLIVDWCGLADRDDSRTS